MNYDGNTLRKRISKPALQTTLPRKVRVGRHLLDVSRLTGFHGLGDHNVAELVTRSAQRCSGFPAAGAGRQVQLLHCRDALGDAVGVAGQQRLRAHQVGFRA
jgi:hypothetical protein